MTCNRRLAILPFVLLVMTVVIFEISDIDYFVQRLFYDNVSHLWLLGRDDVVLRFIFYDGIKVLLLALVVALLLSPVLFKQHPMMVELRPRLILALLSIVITLATASGLKAVTNVACPAQLSVFGGSIPHISLLSSYPEGQRPANRQRCFPAGHASGGFALLSLVFLFKSRRNQRRVIVLGLFLGWTMGMYKMFIGDHFLSHTIMSMLIAWCSISLISLLSRCCSVNNTG